MWVRAVPHRLGLPHIARPHRETTQTGCPWSRPFSSRSVSTPSNLQRLPQPLPHMAMPISSSGFSSDSPCIDEHWDDDAGRGVTRLILAARTGTLSEVCSLCDAGANVNYAPEWDGWDFGGKQYASPLIVAANRGDVDIVRTLLQRGANANFIMCDTDPRSNVKRRTILSKRRRSFFTPQERQHRASSLCGCEASARRRTELLRTPDVRHRLEGLAQRWYGGSHAALKVVVRGAASAPRSHRYAPAAERSVIVFGADGIGQDRHRRGRNLPSTSSAALRRICHPPRLPPASAQIRTACHPPPR